MKLITEGSRLILTDGELTHYFDLDYIWQQWKNDAHVKKSDLYKMISRTREKGQRIEDVRVLDLTLGGGKDALMFLSWGFQVISLERNEIIFKLMENALALAQNSEELKSRWTIVKTEASDYLKNTKEKFDYIYFDPMFDETEVNKKKSLPKKEMQFFRKLIKESSDSVSNKDEELKLLNLARDKVIKRVIVKRFSRQSVIDKNVCAQYSGKTVRYDIYLKN
ncbi:MAG: class I SAM-dependent methyltransferase [Bacteriovoracaceae bacterium]